MDKLHLLITVSPIAMDNFVKNNPCDYDIDFKHMIKYFKAMNGV